MNKKFLLVTLMIIPFIDSTCCTNNTTTKILRHMFWCHKKFYDVTDVVYLDHNSDKIKCVCKCLYGRFKRLMLLEKSPKPECCKLRQVQLITVKN
jgi:hypothetical protein